MRKSNPHIHEEFIIAMFPHVNFEDFDLVEFKLEKNIEKRTEYYDNRYWLIIEEKNIPQDDSGERHAHGFTESIVDDRPIRAKACSLVIRKRRRINKKTGQVINSSKEGVKLLPGTRKPEDILTFLK